MRIFLLLLLFASSVSAQGIAVDPSKRSKIMQQAIDAIEIRPAESNSRLATEFEDQPMLRFGDATRETSDGTLWKIGKHRPQVIIALEFTHSGNRTLLQYEFLCLTSQRFALTTSEGWTWTPASSAIQWKSHSATIAASPPARFRQLKQFVRRFTASEEYQGQKFTLRLMSQPINRYQIDDQSNHEGAVFVFANGTNPEVLLMVESTDEGWRYALARLCGAEPRVTLDGATVWTKPPMSEVGKSWSLDYTGDAREME